MIRITQISLPIDHAASDLSAVICRRLRIGETDLIRYEILRRAIDARKRPSLFFVYTVRAEVRHASAVLRRAKHGSVARDEAVTYRFPESGREPLAHRPVIVGSGPAGLFCACLLAEHGYRPVILERGEEAERRKETVRAFWGGAPLDAESNVQFGEGGAGTFSDGKLNTSVRDASGRNRLVLSILHEAGAPESILYDARPHLGTDALIRILEALRRRITACGGTFCFRTRMDDLITEGDRIRAIRTAEGSVIGADVLVLATGHSARDTYEMLRARGVNMEAKAFAVGLRVMHPQEMIDRNQYGMPAPDVLGAAPYRLTHQSADGHGIYSFCMCPGGYVVNAASEPGMLAVNGMSESGRDSGTANSAIVSTVTPDEIVRYLRDAETAIPDPVLAGATFQRLLEKRAYRAGEGAVPVQRLADFAAGQIGSDAPDDLRICGAYRASDVRGILPDQIADGILAGMDAFDRKIRGFAGRETWFAGVESRTSAPVRILRDTSLQANLRGLYPCGEGAGYAGGITSAAMDGVRVAEAIAAKYQNFSEI